MSREFSSKLFETVQNLNRKSETGNEEAESTTAKQIMCISDDLCFIWSFKDNCVLVLRLDDDKKCVKLIPTDTPLFDVDKITISGTGRWICVWGSRG